MMTTATTLVTGRWRGRISSCSIQMGSVVCWPAVKVVTMTSSKLSANASRPPASRAEPSCGRITYRIVWKLSAPRSIEASINDGLVRRSRATALL